MWIHVWVMVADGTREGGSQQKQYVKCICVYICSGNQIAFSSNGCGSLTSSYSASSTILAQDPLIQVSEWSKNMLEEWTYELQCVRFNPESNWSCQLSHEAFRRMLCEWRKTVHVAKFENHLHFPLRIILKWRTIWFYYASWGYIFPMCNSSWVGMRSDYGHNVDQSANRYENITSDLN